jgi:branched-chain amino acid transport system ATP-binding protein
MFNGKQLEIKNLSKSFGGVAAVNNVNISVPEKAIIGVIGPNGAGKTTFFNLISGFAKPDSGGVFLNNIDISSLPPHEIANFGVARTFQNIRLFPWMTVFDNIVVACQIKTSGNILQACLRTPFIKREEAATLEKVQGILDRFGLLNKADYLAKNLSYGEQRKLEIARALATNPKILLLDEPTAGMNPSESNECVDLIFDINNNFGITILLIEHNMNVVMGISDKVIVLDHGIKIAEDFPDQIQTNIDVKKAYLGEDYVKLYS